MSESDTLHTTESHLSKGAEYRDEKVVHDVKLGAITEEGDDAAQIMRGKRIIFTQAEENKVLRKIDWRLMPLMAVTCGLQFVDKAALGNAAVFGLRDDLNLEGQQFSLAVSIFYIGYLVGTYPAVRLMQRFHAGRVIGVSAVLWGISVLCMMAVNNFSSLMALRFLLGFFESPLNPGFSMITGRWYRQSEQPWRYGIWTLLNGWLPVPFLIVYYGIGTSDGGPLASWRWIFFLLGVITLVVGVCCFFYLPDQPQNVKWLNESEKYIAIERVARSQTGLKNSHYNWSQVREALTDPLCWLLTLQMFFSQSGGAVNTNFLGPVISGFGYSPLRTTLLQTPTFAIQGFICLALTAAVTFLPRFRNLKQPILSVAAAVVITGAAIIYTHESNEANRQLLLGSMYMIAVSNCSFTTILAIVGINSAGTTKKGTLNAMLFIAQCVSNIVIPQTFLDSERPSYKTGILTVMCFQSALILCYWAGWLLMMHRNRQRNKAFAALSAEEQEYQKSIDNEIAEGLRDLTDKQNKLFRYLG